MNKVKLCHAAKELEEKFSEVESLPRTLKGLHDDLRPYIEKSKKWEVDNPIEKSKVPGGYLFNEGELRKFPGIEKAYVHFRMEISGGPSDKEKKLHEKIRNI